MNRRGRPSSLVASSVSYVAHALSAASQRRKASVVVRVANRTQSRVKKARTSAQAREPVGAAGHTHRAGPRSSALKRRAPKPSRWVRPRGSTAPAAWRPAAGSSGRPPEGRSRPGRGGRRSWSARARARRQARRGRMCAGPARRGAQAGTSAGAGRRGSIGKLGEGEDRRRPTGRTRASSRLPGRDSFGSVEKAARLERRPAEGVLIELERGAGRLSSEQDSRDGTDDDGVRRAARGAGRLRSIVIECL